MKSMLTIFILALMAASCGEKCTCPAENINLVFVGYAASEVDTILVKRFEKGSNFARAGDSFRLDPGNSNTGISGDSVRLVIRDFSKMITERYDVVLYNPFDNRTISIADIEINEVESHCGGIFGMDPQPCTSPITGFKKNGVASTLDQSGFFRGLIIRK